jgi:hypothetical protein
MGSPVYRHVGDRNHGDYLALCEIAEAPRTHKYFAFLTPPPHIFTRHKESTSEPSPKKGLKIDRWNTAASHPGRTHVLLFIWVCIRRLWIDQIKTAIENGDSDARVERTTLRKLFPRALAQGWRAQIQPILLPPMLLEVQHWQPLWEIPSV